MRRSSTRGRIRAGVVGLAACLVCLATGGARAAEDEARLWSTVGLSVPLSEEITAAVDFQNRFSDDISELERTLVRPSLTYRWRPYLATTLGYDAHFIESPGPGSSVEHRAWQQVALPLDVAAATLTPRVRLEERFIEDVSGAAVRARLGAFLRFPVGEDERWSLVASNEVHVNLNSRSGGPDSGFDQNRGFVGVATVVADRLAVEVGYLNQWIERDSIPDLVNHTLAITLRSR